MVKTKEPALSALEPPKKRLKREDNKVAPADQPVHDWYRFVLSYPPHLVRDYVEQFGIRNGARVLDPFCGTGTTLVECKKLGIASIGLERHPMSHFACSVKTDWTLDPERLVEAAEAVAAKTAARLGHRVTPRDHLALFEETLPYGAKLRGLTADQHKLLLADSISPKPLHKSLVLLDCIRQSPEATRSPLLLALAKALVSDIGNLHFGPEVGLGEIKEDAPVIEPWLRRVYVMANDLRSFGQRAKVSSVVHRHDARVADEVLKPRSIDAVITSPPYPNEKDYTRTTRLESVILGFINDRAELKALKGGLLRSNTRNIYKADDDARWVEDLPSVQKVADAIEARRIEMGKTSGFERLYHKVTRHYFGGMARHLANLRPALKPGAKLAYVVGDQASYLRVMIRTGQLLGEVAERLGYKVERIDLFRTRLATATREQLREEVVVLIWPG